MTEEEIKRFSLVLREAARIRAEVAIDEDEVSYSGRSEFTEVLPEVHTAGLTPSLAA